MHLWDVIITQPTNQNDFHYRNVKNIGRKENRSFAVVTIRIREEEWMENNVFKIRRRRRRRFQMS